MIRVKHFAIQDTPSITLMIDGKDDCEFFKQLVQNGANLWDQAPPSMKELADLVTSGKKMQEYDKMSDFKKPEVVTNEVKLPECLPHKHAWHRNPAAFTLTCLSCGKEVPEL